MNRTTSPMFTVQAVACALATAAPAQEPLDLGSIVLSAGLSPIAAADYGHAASVVSAREIETRGITTVQEALRALPGVSVNGTSRSDTQVRIRGGETNHTLILIDGIEAAGGDGAYSLSGLETANIERIEVLRGPQSVAYGSDASAGVVNIVTRRGAFGQTYRSTFEVGDATIATAFVAHRGARGGASLALSATDDRGYDQSGDDGERDGQRRATAILAADYAPSSDLTLGFTVRRSEQTYDYDALAFDAADAAAYVVDDPDLTGDRDETTAAAYAELATLDRRLTHRLSYEYTRNDLGFGGESEGDPVTRTTTDAVKYLARLGIDGTAASAGQTLNLLIESERDASDSQPAFDRAATSIALEYRARFASGLSLQAGARYDANDVFDDATTWTVALAYTQASSGIRLHGSAGSGIVNPAYFELYADAFGFVGNPDLSPERNRGYDLGVTFPVFADRGTLDITYFAETLTDEIAAVAGPAALTFANQDGDSDRRGVEVAGDLAATDALSLRLAYTYLDATDPDGRDEIRRPRHELGLGATLATFGGRGTLAADLRHVAGNTDSAFFGDFGTRDLDPFATVDVAARYDLTARLTLTGRVTNLFDSDAVEVLGYAARGRAAYVGLDARF